MKNTNMMILMLKLPLLILLLLNLSLALAHHHPPSNSSTKSLPSAKPGCQTKCANLTVPYPFGIGINSGCSISPLFDVNCDYSSTPPKPFIATTNHEIVDISHNQVRVKNSVAARCYAESGNVTRENMINMSLTSTPYSFSTSNKVTVVGCDDFSVFGSDVGKNFTSGCFSVCDKSGDITDGSCTGIGCCQVAIPKGLKSLVAVLVSAFNHTSVYSFSPCGYVFVGDQERFQFRIWDLEDESFQNRTTQNVPIVLDWAIGEGSCQQAKKSADFACRGNSSCVDSDTGLGGYRCNCLEGMKAIHINECKNNPCDKHATCTNTPGSYSCSCSNGYNGDGRKDGLRCTAVNSQFPVIKFSIDSTDIPGLSVGFFLIYYWCHVAIFWHEEEKLARMRKFFHQNGGLLLKQHMSSNNGGLESTKIFSADELEATNSY
ncbi:UNVERIFIED_CONTAM: Wall-associated receptor kinase-like 1 [Sesamum radiatum]|uniref:Wall-associated receptor kinase-like 1 n=1 Tax=Sesamum radiatum TaxID=300843 RepID=A0AAW2NM63_SESRA